MSKVNLFQILISEDESNNLPSSLLSWSESLTEVFPSADYSLWNNSMISKFLQEKYESEVYQAYQSLVPFAYKSDLARYCLLHHFGGWYFDLGTKVALEYKAIAPISEDIDMIFFWDMGDLLSPARSFYDCMNGVIYAKPSNPVFRIAIDLIIHNCKSKFYGSDSLSPTGPGVFGRAIAIHGKDEKLYDGQFIQLTPQHTQTNKAYILRDGTIFAWHRSRFMSTPNVLNAIGMKGGNDYRQLWKKRMVYK